MNAIHEAAVRMQVSEPGMAALQRENSARGAVTRLLEGGLDQDALKLHAHLLPPSYAVAWVCKCARRQPLAAHDSEGLQLAETWLREPDETHRQRALAFALDHRCADIGAWLAATAAWAGDDSHPQTAVQAAAAAVASITRLSAIAPEGFEPSRHAFVRNALGLLDTYEPST